MSESTKINKWTYKIIAEGTQSENKLTTNAKINELLDLERQMLESGELQMHPSRALPKQLESFLLSNLSKHQRKKYEEHRLQMFEQV
jgi:hypothetical protein